MSPVRVQRADAAGLPLAAWRNRQPTTALRLRGNAPYLRGEVSRTLTPGEQQALWLRSLGLSYGAIAQAMDVSIGAVRDYFRDIPAKMGVGTRMEAVVLMAQRYETWQRQVQQMAVWSREEAAV